MRPTQILTASLLCGAATAALAAAPAQAQSADTEPLEAAPATANKVAGLAWRQH